MRKNIISELNTFPFLQKLIYETLGFLTAILPLYRLIASQSMSLITCIVFWYFSFLNSLARISIEKQEGVKDRWNLGKKAMMRVVDYMRWPLSLVWLVCVIMLGPVLSTGILTGLVIRFLVGKIRRLSVDKLLK